MDEIAGPKLDPRRLLTALDAHNVEYVVVGGLGAMIHGATRVTQDADIVINNHGANLSRVVRAVYSLRGRRRVESEEVDYENAQRAALPGHRGWHVDDMPGAFLSLQTDAGPLDIAPNIPDRNGNKLWYQDLIADARPVAYSNQPGLVIKIASLDHIIESKEHANRTKDHEALPELRTLQQQQQERSRGVQPAQRARDDDHGHSL